MALTLTLTLTPTLTPTLTLTLTLTRWAFRHGQTVLRGTGGVAKRISKAGHNV